MVWSVVGDGEQGLVDGSEGVRMWEGGSGRRVG